MKKEEVENILRNLGCTTKGEIAKNDNPENKSIYTIWYGPDGKEFAYLGNYFVETIENATAYPYADPNLGKRKTLLDFLKFKSS